MQRLSRADLFRQQAFINGQWVDADSGATFEVINPATGQRLGTVPNMGQAETRRAIDAAQAALIDWRAKTAKQRATILRRWYELVLQHQDDLALIMTLEQGKPLAEARAEVTSGACYFEWYAEEGKRAYGEIIPTNSPSQRVLVTREPVGVCAAITPWNFPSSMISRKVGAALGAGCTIVIKPAPQTPYSAYALCVLAQEAGVPPGVLSIITGDAVEIGQEMTSNPTVRKLSFTGSTAVGRKLMAQGADQVKKISLELGGNAPFIVFDDADLEAAVEGALASKYRNAGQTCVCANRIYVQSGIYDAFVEQFSAAVKTIQVGDGTQEGITQGPLIDEAALGKVQSLLDDMIAKGAQVVTGGTSHALGGLFFEPTVIADATAEMRVAREEIFGPLAPIFRFDTEEQVIALANDTEYGLAAYFYSRDMGRIWRVAEGLEYGMVGINTGLLSNEAAPFGGIKQSGIGREGAKHGLDDYLELKYLLMGGI